VNAREEGRRGERGSVLRRAESFNLLKTRAASPEVGGGERGRRGREGGGREREGVRRERERGRGGEDLASRLPRRAESLNAHGDSRSSHRDAEASRLRGDVDEDSLVVSRQQITVVRRPADKEKSPATASETATTAKAPVAAAAAAEQTAGKPPSGLATKEAPPPQTQPDASSAKRTPLQYAAAKYAAERAARAGQNEQSPHSTNAASQQESIVKPFADKTVTSAAGEKVTTGGTPAEASAKTPAAPAVTAQPPTPVCKKAPATSLVKEAPASSSATKPPTNQEASKAPASAYKGAPPPAPSTSSTTPGASEKPPSTTTTTTTTRLPLTPLEAPEPIVSFDTRAYKFTPPAGSNSQTLDGGSATLRRTQSERLAQRPVGIEKRGVTVRETETAKTEIRQAQVTGKEAKPALNKDEQQSLVQKPINAHANVEKAEREETVKGAKVNATPSELEKRVEKDSASVKNKNNDTEAKDMLQGAAKIASPAVTKVTVAKQPPTLIRCPPKQGRSRSEVVIRPGGKMASASGSASLEQAFSALLDDMETFSLSSGTGSDLELSDKEEEVKDASEVTDDSKVRDGEEDTPHVVASSVSVKRSNSLSRDRGGNVVVTLTPLEEVSEERSLRKGSKGADAPDVDNKSAEVPKAEHKHAGESRTQLTNEHRTYEDTTASQGDSKIKENGHTKTSAAALKSASEPTSRVTPIAKGKDIAESVSAAKDKSISDAAVANTTARDTSASETAVTNTYAKDKSIKDKSASDAAVTNTSAKDKSASDAAVTNTTAKDKSIRDTAVRGTAAPTHLDTASPRAPLLADSHRQEDTKGTAAPEPAMDKRGVGVDLQGTRERKDESVSVPKQPSDKSVSF
jgi:hypothetical protein